MQQVMFFISSGVTAMNKSAFAVPASFSPLMDVGLALSVIRSTLSATLASFSSLSSTRVMFWFSLASSWARWVPTAPAPAMMIFMSFVLL